MFDYENVNLQYHINGNIILQLKLYKLIINLIVKSLL